MGGLLAALIRPRRRWPLFAGAAGLVLLAAFATWRLVPHVPSSLPEDAPLLLDVGKLRVLRIECLTRVAVGDPEICDVKTLEDGHGELILVGQKVGETTLLAWDCDGRRHSYTVRVQTPNL